MRMEEKNYPQVYLEECKYKLKKTNMSKFINTELELDSENLAPNYSQSQS